MHLVAFDLTGRDPELIADRCWVAGAAGLWEVDDHTLRAGVEAADLAAFLAAMDDLDPADVTDELAVELAGREATVVFEGHDIELWVPPTVFGDGCHPTTATCLELLVGRIRPGDRVLDVGCGSGALSIAAAVLGGQVTAIDLDPVAVAATADNARRNGVAISTDDRRLDQVDESFDAVVANMTVGSLAPLLADLVRCTTPGGTLVVSGMLDDQWPAIRREIGGTTVEVRSVDGWTSAVIVRHAPSAQLRDAR